MNQPQQKLTKRQIDLLQWANIPNFIIEDDILDHNVGIKYVAGIDEAGMGAWAGPVVVAGVILREKQTDYLSWMSELNDSKKLSPNKRKLLAASIVTDSFGWAVSKMSAAEIDNFGIEKARDKALLKVYSKLKGAYGEIMLIIDGSVSDLVQKTIGRNTCEYLVHGDSISRSVAAASILAKVTRDNYMIKLSEEFPAYKFDVNKGYGVEYHRRALETYGICPEHRRSYKPIAKLLATKGEG